MSEEDADRLHEELERFWCEWRTLVNDTYKRTPEHLQAMLLVRMQEKATVYGTIDI